MMRLAMPCAAVMPLLIPVAIGAQSERPLNFNVSQNVAALLERLEGGQVGRLAIVGDSISFRGDSYNWFLRDFFEDAHGNAGDGYLGFNQGFRHTASNTSGRRPGLWYRRLNTTWAPNATSQGLRDDLGRRSPDGIYTRIGGPGWIEVDFYGPEATVHYVREVGAGVVRATLNGNHVGDFDASLPDGDPQLGLYTFQTGETNPTVLHTLRLELVDATTSDPQWTQLNGLQMTTGEPGLMYHRMARGGVGPDDFLTALPQLYADALVQLAPDLLIVMLDPGRDTQFNTFVQEMNQLIDFYEATLPGTSIVLLSHHPFRPNREQITDWLIEIAEARGHGFINFFDLHEDFDDLWQRGMLIDTVHFNAVGGEWHARYLFDVLRGWVAPVDSAETLGSTVEGSLYELRNRDGERLVQQSQFGFSASEANVLELEVAYHVDAPDADQLDARITWRLDNPGGVARVFLYDWSTMQFDQVAQRSIGNVEVVDEFLDIPRAEFVRASDGRVEFRVRASVVATFSADGFRAMFDDVKIRLR